MVCRFGNDDIPHGHGKHSGEGHQVNKGIDNKCCGSTHVKDEAMRSWISIAGARDGVNAITLLWLNEATVKNDASGQ
jgi:hypothetical protein